MENNQNKTPKFVKYFLEKMNSEKVKKEETSKQPQNPMTGYSRTKVLACKPKEFER